MRGHCLSEDERRRLAGIRPHGGEACRAYAALCALADHRGLVRNSPLRVIGDLARISTETGTGRAIRLLRRAGLVRLDGIHVGARTRIYAVLSIERGWLATLQAAGL